jgi:hypothetical protein
MRPRQGNDGHTRDGSPGWRWIAPRARRSLAWVADAVGELTDEPFRIRPLGEAGPEYLFEAREEPESGVAGASYVVGVDSGRGAVRVISAGRPTGGRVRRG